VVLISVTQQEQARRSEAKAQEEARYLKEHDRRASLDMMKEEISDLLTTNAAPTPPAAPGPGMVILELQMILLYANLIVSYQGLKTLSDHLSIAIIPRWSKVRPYY